MTSEPPEPGLGQVVDVLAPVAVDTAYSYRAPAGLKLEPGAFVRMPLGTRDRKSTRLNSSHSS